MSTDINSLSNTQALEPDNLARKRKIGRFLQSLVSHAAIWIVGSFFLIPFIWMVLTAFKSNQDVFHSPPRWLPYDNVRVSVNGTELPLSLIHI